MDSPFGRYAPWREFALNLSIHRAYRVDSSGFRLLTWSLFDAVEDLCWDMREKHA